MAKNGSEVVRVWIERAEVYPVYYWSTRERVIPGSGWVEVAQKDLDRYRRVADAYDKMQDELAALYESL